jgi:hypothetical protein
MSPKEHLFIPNNFPLINYSVSCPGVAEIFDQCDVPTENGLTRLCENGKKIINNDGTTRWKYKPKYESCSVCPWSKKLTPRQTLTIACTTITTVTIFDL